MLTGAGSNINNKLTPKGRRAINLKETTLFINGGERGSFRSASVDDATIWLMPPIAACPPTAKALSDARLG